MLDQLGDARVAVGEAPDDPQAVDVGEGLVDETEASELIGRIDDRGERGSQVGG
jgi:hypothetical protein